MVVFILLAVIFLTYFNGANDNFKGVATLWGSGTLQYSSALSIATIATFAGSICSYFFADALIAHFSGKGLISDHIIQSEDFILAVALAAGSTIFLATLFGFPVSTTHSLIGALLGAGLVSAGSIDQASLLKTFFLPLLLSPFVAIILCNLLYRALHYSRKATGISEESCMCIGEEWVPVNVIVQTNNFLAVPKLKAAIGSLKNCEVKYDGRFLGINFHPLLNNLHFASAAVVSFARGLNDTPKLVSLLLITRLFNIPVYIGVLAIVMALGGLLNAKKVAHHDE
jgi:PiT family inorganic phosphate transporter